MSGAGTLAEHVHQLTVITISNSALTSKQVGKVVTKALQQVANYALSKRRKRSCPRALRQPVSSWPRLTKNTYKNGGPEYQSIPIKAELP